MDTVTENAKERLLHLQQWLAETHKEIQISEEIVKREAEKLESLKRRANLYNELLKLENGRQELATGPVLRRRLPDRPVRIADAAVEVLKSHETMHYTEIMKELEKMGIEIPGADPRANMTAHLANDNRIEKADQRGYYKLKETKPE